MLYHYTSLDVLQSILKEPATDKGLCFWATRFDCFGDKEEYKLGVETIKRLLPKLENRLQPDRRIASSFKWDEILGNPTLPFPYIVSFTDKVDNEYMWEHYGCKGKGVALELNDSQRIVNENTKNFMVRRCLYVGEISEEDLYKEIENEYVNSAFEFLSGPKKDLVFALLSGFPQLFVALIGRYLLSYVATRIKEKRYLEEEETRGILAAPRQEMNTIIEQYNDIKNAFSLDLEGYKRLMKSEKCRKRASGETVYYQEVYLPGSVLNGVYVRDKSLKEKVNLVLKEKGFETVTVGIA